MNPSLDRADRAASLLAKLEGRLFRASEIPATSRDEPQAFWIGEILQGAERLELESGSLTRLVTRVPLDGAPGPRGVRFPHGAEAPRLRPGHLAFLADREDFSGIPIESIAFLDTETTGLSGGTGTCVFLVGLGCFEGGSFVVDQYFMEDFDEEPALIEALRRRLSSFEALVTYNGASFDLPLLRTRFAFNRVPSVWEKPHLDLLPLARRLWRGRLPSCCLGVVERHMLGLSRISNVEGALIPQIFFNYVRGARREDIIPVIDHHAQDIVSLAAILARIGRLLEEPDHPDFSHASDQLGLAALFERAGETETASGRLCEALRWLRDPDAIYRTSMRVARHCKRRGDWEEAIAIWSGQSSPPQGAIDHHLELAKYHEHRARDFESAVEAVLRARRALTDRREWSHYGGAGSGPSSDGKLLADLDRRERRLRGRMRPAAPKAPAP